MNVHNNEFCCSIYTLGCVFVANSLRTMVLSCYCNVHYSFYTVFIANICLLKGIDEASESEEESEEEKQNEEETKEEEEEEEGKKTPVQVEKKKKKGTI